MFTGIVQHLGRVASVESNPFGLRLTVERAGWGHHPRQGDSIAVNGCCLTVAPETTEGALVFDVIQQTLRISTLGLLRPGDMVNLEHAATPHSLLGGHLVQGHVDGIATIIGVTDGDAERRLKIQPPAALMQLIVDKGSVALDGVSMTVAAVDFSSFEVALIPTTIEQTTLGAATTGARMNIEADCIAKMVGRWLQVEADRTRVH